MHKYYIHISLQKTYVHAVRMYINTYFNKTKNHIQGVGCTYIKNKKLS